MKRVYISTPLKEEKFNITDIQNEILKHKVFAFIPPNSPKVNQHQGSRVDRLSIDLCDEMWVFGAIGRDCSWEIGYADGIGKKLVFYTSDHNRDVTSSDWMIWTGDIEIRELNVDEPQPPF